MMRMMRQFGAVVFVVVILTGCGGTPSGQDADEGGVVVLAKADGWRDGLRDAAGHAYALVEIATDERTAQRAWEGNVPPSLSDADGDPAEPGRYAPLESVDLDRQAVVVYSSGQSGTCPSWVSGIDTVDDRIEVELASTADQGEACTDDFQAYRLVLAVDRDRLPDPARLPVERIDVPTENLTDVEGRAVAYPAEEADPAGAGDEQAGSAAASGDGTGPPAGLEIAGTDRIEIRDVPTDPWPPWPPAEREAADIEEGELVDELTDPDRIGPLVAELDDAHRIDLGNLAYDLAPPDLEVVFLDDDEVLERVGYYHTLDTWGEHDVEGRWLHGWDLLAVTAELPADARQH